MASPSPLASAGIILSVLSIALALVLLFSVDSSTRMAAALAAVIVLAAVGVMWFFPRRRRRTTTTVEIIRDEEIGLGQAEAAASLEDGVGPTRFHYAELAQATDDFHDGRKLGQGGFGAVYHGVLRGSDVAIKRIVREEDGDKSFKAEVKTIGQLNQKNLVKLLGWCREGSCFFVVYEYLPNGSLERHLFGEHSRGVEDTQLLPWEKRYAIVLGLASALKYLHEDLREYCVVHRGIKAANVMLDASFKARLGDFGLARFVKHGNSVQVTSQNEGAIEYVAPEVLYRGRGPSKESDVYSFGVVALEVACGRRASSQPEKEEEKLVAWVRRCHDSGDPLRAADGELGGNFNEGQMRRMMVVGLMCTLQERSHRPSITQVIHYLHPEATTPDLPADTPPFPSPTDHDPFMTPSPVPFVPAITSSVLDVGR